MNSGLDFVIYVVCTHIYTLVMLQALLKHVEFVQNIVYAPGSVKVVFNGSEKMHL